MDFQGRFNIQLSPTTTESAPVGTASLRKEKLSGSPNKGYGMNGDGGETQCAETVSTTGDI